MHKPSSRHLLALLLMTLACAGAQAQGGVYRNVGPDGKVTFSDRPPADAQASAAARVGSTNSPVASGAALPYELKQIATRFPVTIYTGSDCAPCSSLRTMLSSRGVPFTERTVASNEDIAALERLSSSSSLPFGTIGGQQLTGYSDVEWAQYLDAAGYPKQSQLPSNYRPSPATPLVAAKPVAPTAAAAPAQTPPAVRAVPTAPTDGPTQSNPAGIRF